jgi:uncharacterized YceG family protein
VTPLFGGKKGDGGAADHARSAAEREAARLERERRRAEREGRTPPPAPVASEPEPEPEPVAFEPEPVAWEPELVADEPEAEPLAEPDPVAPEPAYEPPPEPIDEEPVYEEPVHVEPVAEPAWEAEPVTVPPEPYEREHEHDTELHPHVEAPAGVKRVSGPSVGDLPQVGGPRPTPPGPVRGPAGRRTRRRDRPATVPRQRGLPRSRRGARRLILLLILLLFVAAAWFVYRVAQPGHDAGDDKQPVAVVIASGSTAGEIADELAKQGVIDSAFFFNLRSRLSGKRGDLKAGRFTLQRDMSYAAALDALTQNPAAAPTVKVTIPEGLSISESAKTVRQTTLRGSYLKAATRNPREVKGFKNYGVPRGTHSLEGFLFPATYELKRGSTARDLVTQQLATFRQTFDRLDRKAAHRKNLSDYDVLIIASMIEREAQTAKDRRLISAVIYNRLQQQIPLGIDATLRYILNNWSRPLKQSELQKDSVFNTRLRQGLPPTPIGSPGLASIKAALNPAKVNYLFYVVKPCGNGSHAFSASDAQFTKDVQAYNRKRAQLGGKDPSHC